MYVCVCMYVWLYAIMYDCVIVRPYVLYIYMVVCMYVCIVWVLYVCVFGSSVYL